MVIELRGVEFVNKGAELMLHAIIQQVKKEYPRAIFTMEHSVRAPRNKQLRHGIYTKTEFKKYRISFRYFLDLIPKAIRRRIYFISEDEINVVLDGSGFAFGDYWGVRKAETRLASHIVRWKKAGKKVVLLPQALGPFSDNALAAKMKVIADNADLIFARDRYSFQHITNVKSNSSNIYLMPDFTNLIDGTPPAYFDEKNFDIAIIPNSKLLESGVFKRSEYLGLLNQMAEKILDSGLNPFFLVHEGLQDLYLVKEVNENFGKEIEIIKEEDPIAVKGIIGMSKGVITSRFHGLVSALSQSIPCLAIGWSHKYEALMEDYNYAEGLINKEDLKQSANFLKKMELILNEDERSRISKILESSARLQKFKSLEMWKIVFERIKD